MPAMRTMEEWEKQFTALQKAVDEELDKAISDARNLIVHLKGISLGLEGIIDRIMGVDEDDRTRNPKVQ